MLNICRIHVLVVPVFCHNKVIFPYSAIIAIMRTVMRDAELASTGPPIKTLDIKKALRCTPSTSLEAFVQIQPSSARSRPISEPLLLQDTQPEASSQDKWL